MLNKDINVRSSIQTKKFTLPPTTVLKSGMMQVVLTWRFLQGET